MEFRHYLDMVRRRKWQILASGLVGAVLAAALSLSQAPTYTSSARILLRPNDPSEQLNPPANAPAQVDPDRYVTAQMDIVTSPAVAQRAASQLGGGSPSRLLRNVTVGQVGTSDLIEVSASAPAPARAAAVANAFAHSYINLRKEAAVASLQRTVNDLNTQLLPLQVRIATLDAQLRVDPLSPGAGAQLAAAATQYQAIEDRQQELQVNIGLQRGQADIVANAAADRATKNASPIRNSVLGGLLGLLLGLGIAYVREMLDDRVRTREDLDRTLGVPVLAELPLDPRSRKDRTRLAVCASPRCALSEATRSLRTTLDLQMTDPVVRTVLVTSAEPGAGKSLVAANLAAAYAQAGLRTVLVDADLRTPRLEPVFGTYPAPLLASSEAIHGFTGLVQELVTAAGVHPAFQVADSLDADLRPDAVTAGETISAMQRRRMEQAALLRTAVESLLFLPAGAEPVGPAELLACDATRLMLGDLAAIADVVIIDSAPLGAVTDAAVLAHRVDGIVLVAAAGQTRRGALGRAVRTVGANARVLGVVLNKVTGFAEYPTRARRRTAAGAELAPPLLPVIRRRALDGGDGRTSEDRGSAPTGSADAWIADGARAHALAEPT